MTNVRGGGISLIVFKPALLSSVKVASLICKATVLSPKGEFLKERTEGSLWFECLSFTLSYLDLVESSLGICDAYSPKERFLKEPLRGVPFVWVLSFLYLIDFKILSPCDTNFSMSYCVGVVGVWVWCGCGAYSPLKFFRCLKMSFQNIFFFKCV